MRAIVIAHLFSFLSYVLFSSIFEVEFALQTIDPTCVLAFGRKLTKFAAEIATQHTSRCLKNFFQRQYNLVIKNAAYCFFLQRKEFYCIITMSMIITSIYQFYFPSIKKAIRSELLIDLYKNGQQPQTSGTNVVTIDKSLPPEKK